MPPNPEDPALVHRVNVGAAGTHVIVIGIGRYDYLEGGGERTTKHHLDLKQLTSPAVSARAVANWFIEKFECPDAPLATVSLVLSEATPQPFVNVKTNDAYTKIPDGSLESVKQALRAWMKRAEVS